MSATNGAQWLIAPQREEPVVIRYFCDLEKCTVWDAPGRRNYVFHSEKKSKLCKGWSICKRWRCRWVSYSFDMGTCSMRVVDGNEITTYGIICIWFLKTCNWRIQRRLRTMIRCAAVCRQNRCKVVLGDAGSLYLSEKMEDAENIIFWSTVPMQMTRDGA